MKQNSTAPSQSEPAAKPTQARLWLYTTPLLKKKLGVLAAREERSVNQIVNRILRRYLAGVEKEHGPLLASEIQVSDGA